MSSPSFQLVRQCLLNGTKIVEPNERISIWNGKSGNAVDSNNYVCNRDFNAPDAIGNPILDKTKPKCVWVNHLFSPSNFTLWARDQFEWNALKHDLRQF